MASRTIVANCTTWLTGFRHALPPEQPQPLPWRRDHREQLLGSARVMFCRSAAACLAIAALLVAPTLGSATQSPSAVGAANSSLAARNSSLAARNNSLAGRNPDVAAFLPPGFAGGGTNATAANGTNTTRTNATVATVPEFTGRACSEASEPGMQGCWPVGISASLKGPYTYKAYTPGDLVVYYHDQTFPNLTDTSGTPPSLRRLTTSHHTAPHMPRQPRASRAAALLARCTTADPPLTTYPPPARLPHPDCEPLQAHQPKSTPAASSWAASCSLRSASSA